MKQFFWLFILCSQLAYGQPHAVYPFTSAHEEARFNALLAETRCVVCQNQSIADSNAPLAKDLRQKIYTMVNEKQTNEDIKHYLVKRYGDFILMTPPVNERTAFLWAFPLIGMLIIGFFLYRFAKR